MSVTTATPLSTVAQKRLRACLPLAAADGSRRPVAVSPDHRIALLASQVCHVFVSLDDTPLPATIGHEREDGADVPVWPCYAQGHALAGTYDQPITERYTNYQYPRGYGYRRVEQPAWLPPTTGAPIWRPLRCDLEALLPVARAAEPDHVRLALNMVSLTPDRDGSTTAVASDGFRLHVRRRLLFPDLTEPLLIPAALVAAVRASDATTIIVGCDRDHPDSSFRRLDALTADGRLVIAAAWHALSPYPDWRQIIPRDRPLSLGPVPADDLLRQVKAATDRIGDDTYALTVWRPDFGDHERRVALQANYAADALRHLGRTPVTVSTTRVDSGPVVIESDTGDWLALVMPVYERPKR